MCGESRPWNWERMWLRHRALGNRKKQAGQSEDKAWVRDIGSGVTGSGGGDFRNEEFGEYCGLPNTSTNNICIDVRLTRGLQSYNNPGEQPTFAAILANHWNAGHKKVE